VKASRNESSLARAVIRDNGTIRDAFVSLDASGVQVVLVTDAMQRIVGLVTDGDLRRALLNGATLADPISPHMRGEFKWVSPDARRDDVLDLMQALRISEVPILDDARRAVGLHLLHDVVGRTSRKNWAVVMAGGRGTRLAPLTDTIPKPMLRVAGRPILERIVLQLVGAGITRIFLAVNYLAHVIEEHFGSGARFGCTIEYLRETQPLGTAGAIALLPEVPARSILVMNGDLMTQAHVGSLLDFHESGDHAATVAVRRYMHNVPFGCIDLDGTRVTGLEEKPTLQKIVNAGIYALTPAFVQKISAAGPVTMPELLSRCIAEGGSIGAWEVEDDWIDVGQREQLDKARGER
jgi:dTDP-glucose pyrophosphorylase